MATSNKANNLISIILISLAAMSPALLKADVVGDWCKRTTHGSLCQEIVNQDRRANLKTSPNGIATILRDRVVATAVAASLKIAPILRDSKDNRTINAVRTCSTDYFDTINTLSAIDLKTVNRQTYAALSQAIKMGNNKADECERSFRDRPAIPSPVTADNVALKQFSLTTMEIIMSTVVCADLPFC